MSSPPQRRRKTFGLLIRPQRHHPAIGSERADIRHHSVIDPRTLEAERNLNPPGKTCKFPDWRLQSPGTPWSFHVDQPRMNHGAGKRCFGGRRRVGPVPRGIGQFSPRACRRPAGDEAKPLGCTNHREFCRCAAALRVYHYPRPANDPDYGSRLSCCLQSVVRLLAFWRQTVGRPLPEFGHIAVDLYFFARRRRYLPAGRASAPKHGAGGGFVDRNLRLGRVSVPSANSMGGNRGPKPLALPTFRSPGPNLKKKLHPGRTGADGTVSGPLRPELIGQNGRQTGSPARGTGETPPHAASSNGLPRAPAGRFRMNFENRFVDMGWQCEQAFSGNRP